MTPTAEIPDTTEADQLAEAEAARRKREDDDDFLAMIALWDSHTGDLYHGILTGENWSYDAKSGVYTSSENVKLGPDRLRSLAVSFEAGVEAEVKAVTRDMLDARLSVAEWEEQILETLRREYILLNALGTGGLNRMTDENVADIQGKPTVGDEMGSGVSDAENRLDNFADELTGPEEDRPSEAETLNRAGQYVAEGYIQYQAGRGASFRRLGEETGVKVKYRNILDPGAEHCRSVGFIEGCSEVSAAGWQDVGDLPAIGTRQCRNRCRCTWVFKIVGSDAAD